MKYIVALFVLAVIGSTTAYMVLRPSANGYWARDYKGYAFHLTLRDAGGSVHGELLTGSTDRQFFAVSGVRSGKHISLHATRGGGLEGDLQGNRMVVWINGDSIHLRRQ